MTEPTSTLGSYLRELRGASKLPTSTILKRLGMILAEYEAIEADRVPVSMVQLQRFADVFDVKIEVLVPLARAFHRNVWSNNPPGIPLDHENMSTKVRFLSKSPAESLFVVYREGWIAGASGRPDLGDMDSEWSIGHADGLRDRLGAMERRLASLGLEDLIMPETL